MSIVIKRNGHALCAKCQKRGCMRYFNTSDDGPLNIVEEYVSDEPCPCCEVDFEVNGNFGI